ncbi:NAD(P)/FAD-dependent oxidoreductase [Candidatus Thorarchaeota archaeon]|nr:MAG: NAD(P)/FAD-dependent oxidoreductase [Candidatus Thorarchaeota archaeon]
MSKFHFIINLEVITTKRIGIIGNGVAAITALREIRSKDSDVEIDIFTDERHAYYPKPNLIDFVAGKRTIDETILYSPDWYEKQSINLLLSKPVIRIDTSSKEIVTSSSTHSGYDSLLIVVGCVPFVPPFEGLSKQSVHVIRTLDDALDIKKAVKGSGREIVVGGGILGIELAAAMKAIGGDPIVVTNINTLLPMQLDEAGSDILLQHLEKLRITVLRGFSCVKISGNNTADGIISEKGDKIEGDLVVIATGVRSNTQLAIDSGISVKRGIVADDHMQTSVSGIFAAGDCMEWRDQWYGIIPWATATARIAAANMLDFGSAKFEGITSSNTLQVAGIDLSSIGIIHPKTSEYESIISSDEQKGTYFKAVLKDDVIVGAISLGDRKIAMKLRGLVNKQTNVSGMKESIFDVE